MAKTDSPVPCTICIVRQLAGIKSVTIVTNVEYRMLVRVWMYGIFPSQDTSTILYFCGPRVAQFLFLAHHS